MMNMKTGKTFLKRTYFADINRACLYIGASVTINCRQLHLIEYADEGTKNYYGSHTGRIFGLIKPEAMANMASLLTQLQSMFDINKLKQIEIKGSFTEKYSCSRGYGLAFEANVSGDEASQWRNMLTTQSDVFYGSTDEFAKEDCETCFTMNSSNSSFKGNNRREEVTTCIIKPHIIKTKQLGKLLEMIGDSVKGYKIEEMEMFHFDKEGATSFFDVYKGLFTYYENMIDHFLEGPSVYLKISGTDNVVEMFREFCGPNDVEVAKHLRPNSLRAKFGSNRVLNAVHCTDLPEDGGLECSYMDKILHL
mmetsp:Transcript_29672/g.38257  ORF Transcript_29672/g.38257 Transcript_29672/m.38257 type:complete len:307 (+) Transcript_29672:197-1117(+)